MKPLRALMRPSTSALLVSLLVAASGCGGDELGDADDYITPCGEARPGEPFASDEAYRAFINAQAGKTVVVDDTRGPRVSLSPEGRIFSANIPPTFRISVPKVTSLEPPGGRAPARGPALPRDMWSRLRRFLSPIGTAHAHCPAFSGENYYLRIYNVRTPERSAYQAILSVTEFVPSLKAWRKAMDSRNGQDVEVAVMRATFAGGTITEGPFVVSMPAKFAVGP
jgi:hypothetical protein